MHLLRSSRVLKYTGHEARFLVRKRMFGYLTYKLAQHSKKPLQKAVAFLERIIVALWKFVWVSTTGNTGTCSSHITSIAIS